MIAAIPSAVLIGVDGHQVSVEVHVSNGLPGFTVVGLPDAAVRESRDRVRAALLSSGLPWPLRRVTVNLAPSGMRKRRCRTRPPDRHRRAGGVGGAGAGGGGIDGICRGARPRWIAPWGAGDRRAGRVAPWIPTGGGRRKCPRSKSRRRMRSPDVADALWPGRSPVRPQRLEGGAGAVAGRRRRRSSFGLPPPRGPDRRVPVDRSVRCPGATPGPACPGGGRRGRPPSVDGRTTRLGQDHVGHPAPWPPSPSRSVHGPRDHPCPLGGRTPVATDRLGLAPSVSLTSPRNVAGSDDRWWNRPHATGRDQYVARRRIVPRRVGRVPHCGPRRPPPTARGRPGQSQSSPRIHDFPRPVHPGGFYESLSMWRRRCVVAPAAAATRPVSGMPDACPGRCWTGSISPSGSTGRRSTN